MPDEEFDEHVDGLLSSQNERVGTSHRVPGDLLGRLLRQAGRHGLPYQAFMGRLLARRAKRRR
jgi:predicted DNA binding CopG/RHH family protein